MTAPGSERIHISIFGSRNAGKSTLANELLGQNLSIVSDTKGTTTDPVSKTMELLPLGPVVITDTAGYDDEGELGEKRVLKTKQILNKTDIAILVINKSVGKTTEDQNFENILKDKGIPVEERKISADELFQALREGRLEEAWGTGTAAVVSPVGHLRFEDKVIQIQDGGIGPISQKLYDNIVGTQLGRIEDVNGWTVTI